MGWITVDFVIVIPSIFRCDLIVCFGKDRIGFRLVDVVDEHAAASEIFVPPGV